VSANYLLVYLRVAPSRGFRRKGRECVQAPCPGEITTAPVAAQQIIERPGESRAIAGRYQKSGSVVLNHVAEASRIERNDWGFA
jgi:hypothetical protein